MLLCRPLIGVWEFLGVFLFLHWERRGKVGIKGELGDVGGRSSRNLVLGRLGPLASKFPSPRFGGGGDFWMGKRDGTVFWSLVCGLATPDRNSYTVLLGPRNQHVLPKSPPHEHRLPLVPSLVPRRRPPSGILSCWGVAGTCACGRAQGGGPPVLRGKGGQGPGKDSAAPWGRGRRRRLAGRSGPGWEMGGLHRGNSVGGFVFPAIGGPSESPPLGL